MTKEEAQEVLDVIECEGFHYAFGSYTNFEEIKDRKFHKLRDAYVQAGEALEAYINDSV